MSTEIVLLPESAQRRNSLVFLLNHSLTYLVAPVFYVGMLHAAVLDSMEASDTVANLPEAVYLWATPAPVLIAWLLPSPRLMRPILATALAAMGAAGFAVAVLFAGGIHRWIVPALVAHAAVIGSCNGVRQMCLWELIGRGVSEQRRGWTLGLTFGLGPVFAVAGSCASQLVLSGNFLGIVRTEPVPQPWNYVLLFGATAPLMWLAAGLIWLAETEAVAASAVQREGSNNGPAGHDTASGWRTMAFAALVGLRQFFMQPLILITVTAFLLTYSGTMIMNNLSLYARDAIGESPESYAGLQLALRFGCKSLAGFALGWLVAHVHARASLSATTSICLAGVLWALLVPGKWYLLSFGLLGAGELYYIYYLNYIVGCSAPQRIRENTAYANLLTAGVGFVPLVFGAVSDHYGIRASFFMAAAMLATALLVVMAGLPKQSRNQSSFETP